MTMKAVRGCATVALLALAACGGREARPVLEVQPGDDGLSCEEIRTAVALNNEAIINLIPERQGDRAQTAFAAGAAILFLPTLFFMDLEAGAANEIEAYVKRNKVLAKRHEIKECEPPLTEQDLLPPELEADDAAKSAETDESL